MPTVRDSTESSGARSPSSATSRSLLARVQGGEPDAWDRLVHLYAPLVLQLCRAGGLHDQDAADAFQEVFRAVVASIGQFHRARDGDTFRGWLRRITQNKVRDHYRRLGREARGAGGSSARDRLAQLPDAEPADELESDDAEPGLLARALGLIRGQFEDRTWATFWQTAVDGREPADVAADLGMSPGAVRVAKCRVLHRLREELGDLAG